MFGISKRMRKLNCLFSRLIRSFMKNRIIRRASKLESNIVSYLDSMLGHKLNDNTARA
jgi:hypothetical protein